MTKLNKNFETLAQRDFDVKQTFELISKYNRPVYWSWGVEKVVNYNDKGLILLVNGHHHKGLLFIRLSWNDTYSYFLLNDDGTIKLERNEIYFDMLQASIDKDIEYIEDYK